MGPLMGQNRVQRRLAVAALCAVATAGCGTTAPEEPVDPLDIVTAPVEAAVVGTTAASAPLVAPSSTLADDVEFTGNATLYRTEVLERFAHDTTAFTQGLVRTESGFFESTGLNGESDLREVDLDGTVQRIVPIDAAYFAEGLELVDDRLVQLTWRSEVAFVYDAATFEEIDRYSYSGEGWGLCSDGARFVMSNGSSRLTFRDLDTFEETGSVEVTVNGTPQDQLNELECVDGRVYANIWQTDAIVRIDPRSGAVDQVIDASGLLDADEAAQANVLNGIAVAGSGEFFVTGKRWPALFRVRFLPA